MKKIFLLVLALLLLPLAVSAAEKNAFQTGARTAMLLNDTLNSREHGLYLKLRQQVDSRSLVSESVYAKLPLAERVNFMVMEYNEDGANLAARVTILNSDGVVKSDSEEFESGGVHYKIDYLQGSVTKSSSLTMTPLGELLRGLIKNNGSAAFFSSCTQGRDGWRGCDYEHFAADGGYVTFYYVPQTARLAGFEVNGLPVFEVVALQQQTAEDAFKLPAFSEK